MSRILVVDDSDFIRFQMVRALVKNGHAVEQANDGQSALDLCVPPCPFDLVLCDLNMLGKYNGLDVIRILRERFPENGPRVIVVTAHDDDSSAIIQLGALGVTTVLAKPVKADTLCQVVHDTLAA